MPEDRIPVAISWSGGKDSALVLAKLLADERYRVAALVSTLVTESDTLAMHGVPRALIEAQAEAAGVPITFVQVAAFPSNEEYEHAMRGALLELRARGIRHIAFGDLFLEDIRAYRDRFLEPLGMTALYPIWGRDTTRLAGDFIDAGFRAILVCTDSARLDVSFCGRDYDRELLRDLPPGVDPCGENGEFHTFVHAGPVFRSPVRVTRAGVAERHGFRYCDIQ